MHSEKIFLRYEYVVSYYSAGTCGNMRVHVLCMICRGNARHNRLQDRAGFAAEVPRWYGKISGGLIVQAGP